eukprot:jgi/Psemu1/223050/e_gw1.1289.3.1
MGCKDTYAQTKQGGEHARSDEFQATAAKFGYIVKPTGADNSFQTRKGECPHQTLMNMVQCLLYSSTIGKEFWSGALLYVCYLTTEHTTVPSTRHPSRHEMAASQTYATYVHLEHQLQ